MKRAQKSNAVRIQPTALRRWIVAGTLATTAVGGGLLLIFARLQAGKAVWTDGFYLNGSQWFDAARTTVTLVGIIGLGGAAFLAYRKQVSTEAGHLLEQSTSLRDRYTTTAEQLGHDSAATDSPVSTPSRPSPTTGTTSETTTSAKSAWISSAHTCEPNAQPLHRGRLPAAPSASTAKSRTSDPRSSTFWPDEAGSEATAWTAPGLDSDSPCSTRT
ncbi:hypothetical protein [Rhodococcus triatomae]